MSEQHGADLVAAAERMAAEGSDWQAVADLSDGARVRAEQRESACLIPATGDEPLSDARHERFLQLYVSTGNATLAYLEASAGQCSRKTAAEQASRCLRRPEVAARLRALQRSEIAERRARARAETGRDDAPLTREELLRGLRARYREGLASGMPSAELSQLADRLARLEGWYGAQGDGADGAVDPALLADYLRRAGEQGLDLAAAARGVLRLRDEGQDADQESHDSAGAPPTAQDDAQGGAEELAEDRP